MWNKGAVMNQNTAKLLAASYAIPLGRDFHTLNSDTVSHVLAAAVEMKYREPKNANGSRARYFYAYLCRAAAGPKWGTEFVVQGNYGYGHGWEDVASEDTRNEARERLREYRENSPGLHRLISRRVKLHD